MGTLIAGLDRLELGMQVTKTWTLPASATTQTLFTVSGGLVAITGLVGHVLTTIGATTTTLALGLGTPTVGGTLDTDGLGAATGITSQETGTLISLTSSAGLAGGLAVGSLAGSGVMLANPVVVNSATITATTSANAGGGVIKWHLYYLPIDNYASVV